jgi:hypothetical protein
MTEVHIWPTLAGVVALTPDAFGFSFCATNAEMEKLRADLKAGVPMAQAVGFSGSACSFDRLVRVESRRGSPTIFVVGRDFLGKAKEDFTFRNQADRDHFFETLLHLLGPSWKWDLVPTSNCLVLMLLTGGALFGLFNIACGGLLLSVPVTPKPGVTPMPEGVMWGFIGFGLVVAAACVAGVFWVLKAGKTGKSNWEAISKR